MGRVALLNSDTMMGPLQCGVVWGDTVAEEEILSITFPQNISREDFDRMKAEITAALQQAELRGEQKATAFLMGEGSGTPVGIVGQSEQHPELTRPQAYMQAVMGIEEEVMSSEVVLIDKDGYGHIIPIITVGNASATDGEQ